MTDAFRDQEARVLAATHFGQNLVVEAGAGTGKTSLLVERALNLHLSSTCNLRDQVIITFTNKAAAELKFRIAKALSEITEAQDSLKTSFSEAGRSYRWLTEEQGIDPEKLKPLARQALRELEQTSIQTIHAYCSSILRRHPMEAKLPPDYVPDEGEARKILLEEFWPEFMANELGKDGKNHDRWFQILQEFPQEEVQHVARAFVQTPLALNMLVREGYKTIDPKVFYAQEHTAYLNWLEGALPALTGESKLKEMVETQIRMLKVLEHGGLSALQNFPEDQVRPGTFWSVSKIYALPKDLQKDPAWDGFQDELKVIRDHLKFLANKLDPRNLETLMKGIAIFADAFDKESARIGAPALDDLLLRARNLLQDHPDVRDQEMQRAKAILLDEFQDTDPLQYDIVFLLASGKEYGDLIPGKLFIVGDPKQSIYRFRGADIRAYQRTVAHIVECGGRALSLTTNFRSLPEVLAPLNKVFGPWMGDDPESPNYQPLNAARKPSSESAAVEVWHVGLSGEASVRERREAEAKVLASSLAKWQREGRYAFRDMAILFRALTEVAIYTRALREEGIDYVVDGGKMFTNRPEVTEALTLLRALANPADRVAALGVLRCSVGGVTDGDLYAFRQAGGSFIWRSAEATEAYREEHPSVVQTFDWLRELDKKTRDLPIDRRILQILTEGDFPILMASYFEGAQRVANVKKLAYRAADMARERMFSLDETVQALEREFGDDYNEGESPLADEAADSVRILSIHAAKGLEFPLVCLADLRPDQPRGAYGAKVRVVHHQGKDYLGVSNRGKPDLPSHIAQRKTQSRMWPKGSA
ncbi:MAG: UvrD-helicase domain-containing protein [Candidatus Eisenbacteria bacterium]|uniref:DNA 3'-5' helicase n=1 Tax=Eiseniibacteriota bacterium TaxID=2212470 RepID=A0A7Y2EC45_UNCEI|nr:UvrD-helicase domain-containing protein [Candidatus Eisenbacteria bacterium]